jgi:hypothetical protein
MRAGAELRRAHTRSQIMGKTRIVVTCPQTGVVVITNFAYEDMITPGKSPKYFACPCGETHTLTFARQRSGQRESEPIDNHRTG